MVYLIENKFLIKQKILLIVNNNIMKMIKYTSILITVFFFSCIYCKAQALQENVQNEIIGTWIAEDDTKVKLIFNTSGVLSDYYDNELMDTYDYSISHLCGSESDNKAWFLRTSNQNELEIRCYELYGANPNNSQILSIRDMTTGKIFIYNKG
ncbi:hypothetical protein N9Q58_04540 [Polaribacter sp.]|nr:hypothetical protein [Polaribacter sp.]